MPQTSVSERMAKAYAGQISQAGAPRYSRSARAEGAVSAGQPVKRGTLPQTQVEAFEAGDLPDGENFAGFVILSTTRAHSDSGVIDDGEDCSVMRMGLMYLNFAEAVTSGERVGLTLATGALSGLAEGVSPGTGVVILPGCRIVETIGAAGLAEVEIDIRSADEAEGMLNELTPPAFAANDLVVPNYPAPGSVIDIPTTAGVSTVTLPALAHEGQTLRFVADGTKNGHTVQYRDATGPVNLTAALTASKRHQVDCTFLNGIWTAAAAVAP